MRARRVEEEFPVCHWIRSIQSVNGSSALEANRQLDFEARIRLYIAEFFLLWEVGDVDARGRSGWRPSVATATQLNRLLSWLHRSSFTRCGGCSPKCHWRSVAFVTCDPKSKGSVAIGIFEAFSLGLIQHGMRCSKARAMFSSMLLASLVFELTHAGCFSFPMEQR
jgi:hypothetical protein